jgi:hypothetical protein
LRRIVAIALALLPACSLFTSLGDLDEEAVDGPDATPETAALVEGGVSPQVDATIDAPAADADAGFPNLHPNGEMEFSCQGWYPYNATLTGDTTARTGMGSCRVCADKTVQDTASFDEFGAVQDPVKGGVYYAAAWVRAAPDKPPPPSGVFLYFGTRDSTNADVESVLTPPIAIDATWKKLDLQLTITKDAKKLRIYGAGTAQLGTCFLVDDVRVERRQ